VKRSETGRGLYRLDKWCSNNITVVVSWSQRTEFVVFGGFIGAPGLDGCYAVLEERDLCWTAASLRATTRLRVKTLGSGYDPLHRVRLWEGLGMCCGYQEEEYGPSEH